MAGSVQKRGDSYLLTVSCGNGLGGKRLRHTRTIKAKNDKDAEKQLAIFISEIENGQVLDGAKMKFEAFVEKWIADYATRNLAPKTLFRYKQMLDSRIIPAIGHIPLGKLMPLHLVEFYNNLTEDGIREDKIKKDGEFIKKSGGLSEQTILHHHRLISAILQDAVEWLMIKTNPAKNAKPPKVPKKEMRYYDLNMALELQTLLNNTEPKHIKYKTACLLTLYTGMRNEELLGLEWSDVDYKNKLLKIEKASQYVPTHGIITKDTKNNSSSRTISIPNEMIPLLKEYELWQKSERLKTGDKWVNSNRLFTKQNGEPIFPDTISKWFNKFIVKNNLPSLNFHGLRHTHATLLVGMDINIKEISSRLGHEDTSTTLNTYSHALRSVDTNTAKKFGKLLSKGK